MRDPLEYPEDFLWIHCHDRHLRAIPADRLQRLRAGMEAPCDAVERRLVDDPAWLNVLCNHALGETVITIHEDEPLPAWNEAWLIAIDVPPGARQNNGGQS